MRALVDRFSGQVFCLCYRMLGDRHDAEDVTQESFCRALRSLGNWDAGRRFHALAAGHRRQSVPNLVGCPLETTPHHRPRRPLGRGLAARAGGRGAPGRNPVALSGMRTEYRQAFLLFHQDEMSYQEIAAALDRPIGTVKTWVHRARREMAQFLIARGALEDNTDVVAEFDRRLQCRLIVASRPSRIGGCPTCASLPGLPADACDANPHCRTVDAWAIRPTRARCLRLCFPRGSWPGSSMSPGRLPAARRTLAHHTRRLVGARASSRNPPERLALGTASARRFARVHLQIAVQEPQPSVSSREWPSRCASRTAGY